MKPNSFTLSAAYPNQRVIKIANKKASAPYAQINIDVLHYAAKDLIPKYSPAFDLWIYLSKNQTDYEMTLSPVLIEQDFGLSKDRYQKGFNVLKEKGYLEELSKTRFIFHQVPDDRYKPKEKKSCHKTEKNLPEGKSCYEKQDNSLKKSQEIQLKEAGNSSKTILHNITSTTNIIYQQQPQKTAGKHILDGYTLTGQTIVYSEAIALAKGDSKRFQLIGDYLYDSQKMEAISVFRF